MPLTTARVRARLQLRWPAGIGLVCAAACALLVALVAPQEARAVPRYAARYHQRCGLCHQDVSGGGMRSSYASQFLAPTELAWRTTPSEELEQIDPSIGRNVSVGFDLRTFHHYTDDGRTPGNFFQMQGDLYLAFQLNDRLSAYLDRGMSGSTELFGTVHLLPASGYVKVGRFAPPYGWRFADHEAFVRDLQGFAPPTHTDVGFEIGLFPGRFTLQAALLNGAPGSPRDNDRRLAVAGRGSWRWRLGELKACVGGSGWHHDFEGGSSAVTGPFWSLAWGRLTWLGELGWMRDDAAVGADTQSWTASHEVALQLVQGLDLIATYDFHDPDIDVESGTRERIGGGLEFFTYPFLQLRLFCNLHRTEGSALGDEDYVQTEGQVHFLY